MKISSDPGPPGFVFYIPTISNSQRQSIILISYCILMAQRILILPLLFLLGACSFNQQPIEKGMIISESTRLKGGAYNLHSKDNTDPIITIQGEGITVDFEQVVLQGSDSSVRADEFTGLAVLIKGGKNITIKNLKAKGFKVAIMAEGTQNLVIENCDLSYNYRMHLNSTPQREDMSDWMSYHHNENDEWLRYGAAIYLKDCNDATLDRNTVTQGQNALMLTRSNNARITNNIFSFNSGIGIGLYRSSQNTIAFNNLNFNVRGYSHGAYSRGQDSAGILVYEQSNENVFYMNSVTHSGDGLFLWAGQTTMDTGKGGCNDNLIINNDFSFAPTNGVEVTFSRNSIANNKIHECDHGIWGGYSYGSKIIHNDFKDNRIDIAIEHGQHNDIAKNTFLNSTEGIKLWQRESQPEGWGYAENRDTKSQGYLIINNIFRNVKQPFHVEATSNLKIYNNTLSTLYLSPFSKTVTGLDTLASEGDPLTVNEDFSKFIPEVQNPINPFTDSIRFKGRDKIIITEWGPYNYKYPLIWNTNPLDTGRNLELNFLGPKGSWKVIDTEGLNGLSAIEGEMPKSINVLRHKGEQIDILIDVEFIGEEFIDQYGDVNPKNKPYHFYYRRFFQPIDFTVNFFDFDSANNSLNTGLLFPENVRVRPFKTEKVNRLEYAWWGGIKENGTHKQFLTIAEGEAEMKGGEYEIEVTWDDAVRVFIDDELIIDEWSKLKNDYDESPHQSVKVDLKAGKHQFRVEHLELGGMATLALKVIILR